VREKQVRQLDALQPAQTAAYATSQNRRKTDTDKAERKLVRKAHFGERESMRRQEEN
jgi:hypothetical protein